MRDLSDCPDGSASTCRGEGGPTIALSRAAERATIKRYSHGKEYMFVHRRWRRRLQRAVGPGHGRRRAFGSPDREHARDTGVAETHRDVRRDAIRRRAIGHAIRHRAIWHAATTPDAVTGDGRYRTRRARWDAIRRRAIPHATRLTARDPATGHSARDPATDTTARDDHP